MDKNTLSNYGWIVVLILVLSVLLALATPFGRFVADGFEATYTGFAHVANGEDGNKILQAAGMNGTANGGSGSGETKTCDNDYHYSLLSKKELVCDICGADTTTATAPENQEPEQTDKHLYRFTFMPSSSESNYSWMFFDVMESEPNKAYLGGFTPYDDYGDDGWEGKIPYSNKCSCSPYETMIGDANAKGFTFDVNAGTVICPCGATTYSNGELLDSTCEHTNGNFVVDSYNAEDHILMCTDCNNYLNCVREDHYDNNNDNACDVCGYINAENCSHINGSYIRNLNGTHNFECFDCLSYQFNVDCNFVNGACVGCNAKDPATCTHINIYGNNNGDGTHNIVCDDCGSSTVIGETHTDNNSDGSCDVCGYTAPVDPATCSHGDTYAYNCWDGTHNVSCNRCGTDIVIGEAHTDADNDNICDKCYASIN